MRQIYARLYKKYSFGHSTEASYKGSKALEAKGSKNYGTKIGRGVESYNYYNSIWEGRAIVINMEVMKNGYEQPYAILFDKK